MIKNARTLLSEHIQLNWDQEERVVQAMKEYTLQFVGQINEQVQQEILSIGEISHNSIAAIRQNATISAYRGASQICSVVKDEIQ